MSDNATDAPVISVATPSFREYLVETIESVLDRTVTSPSTINSTVSSSEITVG